MTTMLRGALLATTLTLAACGGGREPERPAPRVARVPVPLSPETRSELLPATPYVDGPLDLRVVYPPAGARIAVRDSTFIFGSTGTGDAALAINGHVVPVARNGAFLAFLPVPQDGVWRLDASTQNERDTLSVAVELPAPGTTETLTFAPGSVFPRGSRVALAGEPVEVGFVGRRGGYARLVLPDGSVVPLESTSGSGELATYRGVFPATRVNSGDTSIAWPRLADEFRPTYPTPSDIDRPAVLELIFDGDTVRRPLPLNLLVLEPAAPRVGVVRDPRPLAERGDAQIIARPGPGGGPYEWFWPDGTELTITGEADGQYRVRLTEDLSVWSPADEIDVLPPGVAQPASRVGDVNIRPTDGWIDVRIPVSRRLPFRVFEGENRIGIEVYGATSRTNRIDYGTLDPFVERAEWEQPSDGLYRFTLHLNGWAWGHQVFHDPSGWIVLRVRRPPAIDADRPLAGRAIAVDAGHGGAASGAQGPTGLREADVALAVARSLARQLEAAGARPILVRNEDVDIALEERVARATEAGAEMMLSIHMDAFPDGVNPYRNAGTHIFYFHPRAADLARNLQRELLDELGLPDRGINRADLALARPTWMPSVLTESMFMMIPQWEAAMRDPAVIDRIARAHLRGIEGFLAQRGASQR